MPVKKHHHHHHHGSAKHNPKTSQQQSHDDRSGNVNQSKNDLVEQISGVRMASHPPWPDLPAGQGELFFECTLFLYSVLALFLQYLNLYKTLWWLPNSHWHYSIKFHLIDPHLLSCVGLLLGLRVTRCFWISLSEVMAPLLVTNRWLHVIEWGLIKLPLTAGVATSFLFSFLRVLRTYPLTSVLNLAYPLLVFCLLFYNETVQRGWSGRGLLDVDSVAHLCSQSPSHMREEADVLIVDFYIRLKYCLFAAFSTSYLAVYVPCIFVPSALHVYTFWTLELVGIVALTSFGLYMAYMFPIGYCDLLHRSACHLGAWDRLDRSSPVSALPYPTWSEGDSVWTEGSIVKHGRSLYKARGSTVAAEPGNADHWRFYLIGGNWSTMVNGMCIFEGFLIFAQFFMLVHTTDWQHIITLVLLMFANYVLLYKVFKDKVIMGRIYHPSSEDEELIHSWLNAS